MLLAESTAQYVVPSTSVMYGIDCSVCKKEIRSEPFEEMQDSLILTTSVESQGETILSHTHISCIQSLVNEVPSVYMEFEDLRNSYLQAV